METPKIWFVTGASKGMGLQIAKTVLAGGGKVVATVRSKPEQLSEALNHHPNLHIVLLDVTNAAQALAVAAQAIKHFERIDVLVNNAGFGLLGGIEEITDEEARHQYDTNVFGLLNVIRAVLPYMRNQRSGHIINISSLYGFGANRPGWGIYGSTKFAVEGISESLALEVKPLGIHVTAVEPGLFRTNFLDEHSFVQSKNTIGDYAETVGKIRNSITERNGSQPGDPAKLGQALIRLVNTKNPPLHLPLGKDSVALYQDKKTRIEKEMSEWTDITNSTNYQDSL